MKELLNRLQLWQNTPCVSGREQIPSEADLKALFLNRETEIDPYGNIIVKIPSSNPDAKTLLIEAHRDEIGVCITEIHEGGFVSVVPCGGIDRKILPSTVFSLYGKKIVRAVAADLPPHLTKATKSEEKSKTEGLDGIFLDTGILCGLDEILSVGDVGHFDASVTLLLNRKISSRGLDDKAGVLAMQIAIDELKSPAFHTYFAFTCSEESSQAGIRSLCRRIRPDYSVSLDVGFAYSDGMDATKCIFMDQGPSVSFSDTLSYALTNWIFSVADQNSLPCQKIAEPGYPGTNATTIQIQCGGIPSALISIPLLNMHTPSEIVSVYDIQKTAELLVAIATAETLPEIEE